MRLHMMHSQPSVSACTACVYATNNSRTALMHDLLSYLDQIGVIQTMSSLVRESMFVRTMIELIDCCVTWFVSYVVVVFSSVPDRSIRPIYIALYC